MLNSGLRIRYRAIGLVLLWAASLLICDRISGWMLNRLVMSSQLRYSRLYRGDLSSDIVVIGNSRGVNGFYIPEIERLTNLRAVNLSYNGMSAEIASTIFMDYVEHNNSPRLLLFEITCIESDSSLLSNLRPFDRLSPGLNALDARENPEAHLVSNIFHLFRYNNEMFLRTLYYFNRPDQEWINRRHIDEVFASDWRPGDQDIEAWDKVDPIGLAALQKLQAFCRDRHIELRLIITPYLPAYYQQVHRGPSVWAKNLAHRIDPSDRIWDFSNSVSETTFFADLVHMNDGGGKRFSEILHENGIFTLLE